MAVHRPIRCRRRLSRHLRVHLRTRARIRIRGTLEQADIGPLRAGPRSAALRDLWEARRQRSGTPTPSASRCGTRTARATAERSRTNSSCAGGGAHAPRRRSIAAEPGTDSSPRLRFKLVDASFDGASSATLRFDQMLDARFWGIGFTFETLDLCDAFAQQVVRSATGRLASDLLGLQRIPERFSPKTLKGDLKIVPHPGETFRALDTRHPERR